MAKKIQPSLKEDLKRLFSIRKEYRDKKKRKKFFTAMTSSEFFDIFIVIIIIKIIELLFQTMKNDLLTYIFIIAPFSFVISIAIYILCKIATIFEIYEGIAVNKKLLPHFLFLIVLLVIAFSLLFFYLGVLNLCTLILGLIILIVLSIILILLIYFLLRWLKS